MKQRLMIESEEVAAWNCDKMCFQLVGREPKSLVFQCCFSQQFLSALKLVGKQQDWRKDRNSWLDGGRLSRAKAAVTWPLIAAESAKILWKKCKDL